MSTPMLVNDRRTSRTMLVIAAPEKPFDNAEAVSWFVERGGKVIIAANSTNVRRVDKFDVNSSMHRL